ncbi:MAG TPA: cell division protein FtsZ [Spirochaetia bacterium]|nr:MAG: cell division protein FtsZ [Spirochaetes bacterium GWB1_36_13]HCL55474.1 cell division protein FtsZ [Spirochaetia bacterium]
MKDEYLNPTNIKVVGIGGGGCNAINRMIEKGFNNVEFIALNTDAQALSSNKAGEGNQGQKFKIGNQLTRGLGAGANPEIGEKAATESKDAIKECLKDANMVFIASGMGGGTGTGASPVVAQIAKEMGILTIAVVTKPFQFEGKRRMNQAEEGIKKLEKNVDSVIVIPNQRLVEIYNDDNFSLIDAFLKVDDILGYGIQGIAEIINKPGVINVDFADVQSIMKGAGNALMGIGIGTGKNRAIDAAERAVHNPLLDINISGAKGILVNVSGGKDLSLSEYNKIVSYITSNAHPEANIIAGALIDESLKDQVSVTLIATSFDSAAKIHETVSVEKTEEKRQPHLIHHQEPLKEEKKQPAAILKEEAVYQPASQNKFKSDSLFNQQEDLFPENKLIKKEEMKNFFEDDYENKNFFDDIDTPTFLRNIGR